MARAVGGGPPGLAHRVLGDGGADPGRRFRHPRRRLGPGLSASRERGGADPGGARQAAGAAVGAQRHGADGRGEDGEVGREHPPASRRAGAVRSRRARHVLPRRPLPPAAGLLGGAARGGGRARAARARGRAPARARRQPRRPGGAFATASSPRSRRTSARRRRWPRCSSGFARRTSASGSATRTCARCWACSDWRTCSSRRRRRSTRRRRELLEQRERARADRDFEEADRLRDELVARGWDVRDGPDGPELVRRDP